MASFQVEKDGELPHGLCSLCFENTVAAYAFRQLCDKSARHWMQVVSLMPDIEPPTKEDKAYYMFYNGEYTTVISDREQKAPTINKALLRLNTNFETDEVKEQSSFVTGKPMTKRTQTAWRCPDCHKNFAMPVQLNSHLKKTMKRACRECGLVLYKRKFANHMHQMHGKVVYSCNFCYQILLDQTALDFHLVQSHNHEHQCRVCGSGFNNARALSAHMYSHTLLHCNNCGVSFDNRKCFVYHKTQCKRSPEEPHSSEYICDYCKNSYTKKPSLRIHIIQKHLNVLPYACEVCGKRTSTLAHLRSHEKVHTLMRKTFTCDCGSTFKSELGYQLHMRIHTGERPYECEECGEKFLSSSRRLDHIKRRHRSTKDMPHGCPLCPARFIAEETFFPSGVCIACTSAAMSAQQFRIHVRNSLRSWTKAMDSLAKIPNSATGSPKSLCTFIKQDTFQMHTVKDYISGNSEQMFNSLKLRLTKREGGTLKKRRFNRVGIRCSCPDCDRMFYSPFYLRVHLQHSGYKEACSHCGQVCNRGKDITEHLETAHAEKTFLCKNCPLYFTEEATLKKHVVDAHKKSHWTCVECGRTFPTKTTFELHSQMHAVRTCRSCNTQFTNRACYREHRLQCEPDARPEFQLMPRNKRVNARDPATYICDYCSKTYLTRPQLKNHIMWIHMNMRPHQCQFCGKRFYTPARLAEHTVVHTRERNFECDICGAKLVTKMAMVYHRRRHTGERPYPCEDCGEAFISASRRLEHAKKKHGKGPRLQCLQCPSTFSRKVDYSKHMEKMHRTQGVDIVKTLS
ncbi:hypothetical protein ACJJTC_002664 [Scirpophaga incertulas]